MGENKEKSQNSCSTDPDAFLVPLLFLQVLEYNAIGGKYNRGLTVVVTFRELLEPGKQDPDSLQRALTVGWCVELVRRMGNSRRRRGLLEWGCPGWDGVGQEEWAGNSLLGCVSVPLVCWGQT